MRSVQPCSSACRCPRVWAMARAGIPLFTHARCRRPEGRHCDPGPPPVGFPGRERAGAVRLVRPEAAVLHRVFMQIGASRERQLGRRRQRQRQLQGCSTALSAPMARPGLVAPGELKWPVHRPAQTAGTTCRLPSCWPSISRPSPRATVGFGAAGREGTMHAFRHGSCAVLPPGSNVHATLPACLQSRCPSLQP